MVGWLEKKADPKWLPAIWLGKTLSNDCHVLCDRGTILVSRSIRRLPNGFNLEMLGQVESAPCDHGLTSLGHKLLQTKRHQGPGPMPAMAAAQTPDEAAEDPPSEEEGRGVVDEEVAEASRALDVKVDEQHGGSENIPSKAGMKPPPTMLQLLVMLKCMDLHLLLLHMWVCHQLPLFRLMMMMI